VAELGEQAFWFDDFRLGLTHGNGSVASLPLKLRSGLVLFVDPTRGIGFDELYRLGDCKRWMDLREQVDVIFNPAASATRFSYAILFASLQS